MQPNGWIRARNWAHYTYTLNNLIQSLCKQNVRKRICISTMAVVAIYTHMFCVRHTCIYINFVRLFRGPDIQHDIAINRIFDIDIHNMYVRSQVYRLWGPQRATKFRNPFSKGRWRGDMFTPGWGKRQDRFRVADGLSQNDNTRTNQVIKWLYDHMTIWSEDQRV